MAFVQTSSARRDRKGHRSLQPAPFLSQHRSSGRGHTRTLGLWSTSLGSVDRARAPFKVSLRRAWLMAVGSSVTCTFGAPQEIVTFLPVLCARGVPWFADARARRRSRVSPEILVHLQSHSPLSSKWPAGKDDVARKGIAAAKRPCRGRGEVRAELSRQDAVRLRAATRKSSPRVDARSTGGAGLGFGAANAYKFRAFYRANQHLFSDEEPVQLGFALSECHTVKPPRSDSRHAWRTELGECDDLNFEPPTRSELMKARWRDPVWRAAMLARRNTPEALRKRAEVARKQWQDPVFRARMRDARLGRLAPNKGVPHSDMTRLRMSLSRRGVKKSEETRRRMSEGKLNRPTDDTWPKRIAESKRGKTREYFQMRREFRALHKDLKLWSDSYRGQYGGVPKESTFETRVAAPMLIIKIKRYLMLKRVGGFGDDAAIGYEIITPD
jgi:hypothetical protein